MNLSVTYPQKRKRIRWELIVVCLGIFISPILRNVKLLRPFYHVAVFAVTTYVVVRVPNNEEKTKRIQNFPNMVLL